MFSVTSLAAISNEYEFFQVFRHENSHINSFALKSAWLTNVEIHLQSLKLRLNCSEIFKIDDCTSSAGVTVRS